MENNIGVPQKITSRTTTWSSNSTFGYLSKENENTNCFLKDICCPSVHCSVISGSQDKKTT